MEIGGNFRQRRRNGKAKGRVKKQHSCWPQSRNNRAETITEILTVVGAGGGGGAQDGRSAGKKKEEEKQDNLRYDHSALNSSWFEKIKIRTKSQHRNLYQHQLDVGGFQIIFYRAKPCNVNREAQQNPEPICPPFHLFSKVSEAKISIIKERGPDEPGGDCCYDTTTIITLT